VKKRLYDTHAWRKARKLFLNENPLCAYCKLQGRITPANIVDHIKPHNNNPELFWDQDNWQALCEPCHNSIKQMEERSGFMAGAGVNGEPIDSRHGWYR